MGALQTYRARERGYVDDRMVEEDEMFSTTAPKGTWMALLDEEGQELPEPEPASPVDHHAEAIDEVRRELTEKARKIIEDMRTDFDEKLKAETSRADHAETLVSQAHEATDKATKRAEDAEKERAALKAEIEKLKAPVKK